MQVAVAVETGVVVVHLLQLNHVVEQAVEEKVQVVTQTTQQQEALTLEVVAAVAVLVLVEVVQLVDQV
tara:strand:+ start:642 stop:845 length:204 start_codon:yes stop_codon:yes gene_type:complete